MKPFDRSSAAFVLTIALSGATAIVLAGCSSARSSASSQTGDDFNIVTRQDIAESGARTAWDAVRRTVPGINFTENSHGQPTNMSRRGPSSVVLADIAQVFLDGVRLVDFRALDQIPAENIATIRIMSGIDATTQYGTNSGDGAIVIRTVGNN